MQITNFDILKVEEIASDLRADAYSRDCEVADDDEEERILTYIDVIEMTIKAKLHRECEDLFDSEIFKAFTLGRACEIYRNTEAKYATNSFSTAMTKEIKDALAVKRKVGRPKTKGTK